VIQREAEKTDRENRVLKGKRTNDKAEEGNLITAGAG
jgi:hypothetical protein